MLIERVCNNGDFAVNYAFHEPFQMKKLMTALPLLLVSHCFRPYTNTQFAVLLAFCLLLVWWLVLATKVLLVSAAIRLCSIGDRAKN